METLKEELSLLFKNDKSYKTFVATEDEYKIKDMWFGIDFNRIVAYNLSKGLFKKKSIIFLKTGVRIDDSFYTLLGCESITEKGSIYIFKYVDTTVEFKLDKDIVDYLKKMLVIIHKYEQKGHNYAYGNVVEKDLDKALYYYNETIGLDFAFQSGVFSTTAYGYFNQKKYILAYAYCKSGIKHNYDKVYCHYLIGFMYHYGLDFDTDYNKALYYYDEGLKIDIHDSNICFQKAQLYYFQLKEYDKVLETVMQAKDLTQAYNLLGLCYSNGYGCDKDIDMANDYFKKAIKNKVYIAYQNLIKNAIYTREYGNIQDGTNALDYIKEYSKHYNDYNYLYGQLYYNGIGVKVDGNKALDYFNKHLEKYPDDYKAYYQIGKIYYEYGEFETAYSYLNHCYKNGMTNGNYFLSEMYKNGYYVQYDDNKVLELLEDGIKDNDYECYLGLAEYYFDQRDSSAIKKGYELIQKAVMFENEGNLAILTYIIYVENLIGITTMEEYKEHLEFIYKIFELRGRWFGKEFKSLEKKYVDRVIYFSELKKNENKIDGKKSKAIYIYSGNKHHVFLLTNSLKVKYIPKNKVELYDERVGSYYTIYYDNYKNVNIVKKRLRIEDYFLD